MLRRSVLLAAAGSALALPHTAFSQGRLRYTAATAPDSITREILRNSLARLDVGPYDVLTNLSMNFGQIIDQNFARMNGQRIGMLLDNMRPMELQALAQLYTNATANMARSSRLHELLALRLDGARLGHVSRVFGFAPMYEAINRLAPEKSMQFMENSNPRFRSPTPGESPLGASAMKPVRFM